MTSVMSLYLAGTDTTSSQLYWAFLYAVLHPEIQTRIYSEIKEHIGELVLLLCNCSDINGLFFKFSTLVMKPSKN